LISIIFSQEEKKMKPLKWIPFLLAIMILVSGCSKKVMENQASTETPEEKPVATAPAPTPAPTPAPQPDMSAQERTDFLNQLVFFEFDSAVLTPKAQDLLQSKAQWLKDNPDVVAVLIEGHCDERGTDAYNMALGARRANAVKNYLLDLGVDVTKLDAQSFGEEKPAVQGHNEEAWAQNRRASFVLD
jgi:peptidoglycan-associated lipoprotein